MGIIVYARSRILTRILILQFELLTTSFLFGADCKKEPTVAEQPARTDQQISNDVQAKISAESALSEQNIQVAVANGVATLSGAANDDASRALAGNMQRRHGGRLYKRCNCETADGSSRTPPRFPSENANGNTVWENR